ncbi:hypothetical protein N7471_004360 [Penicillium samsonianum]|uniref:uncharacterized protein n=1 Tax=Penicillium samsonianum TaxID=1882272 RepID=UPI002549AD61|nr:uncharacterized protein N7471_004360 [Penicillium samsonianum]KAJ6137874.1 hypothetical protein N7471_004360 [Penicillium samsonianum]
MRPAASMNAWTALHPPARPRPPTAATTNKRKTHRGGRGGQKKKGKQSSEAIYTAVARAGCVSSAAPRSHFVSRFICGRRLSFMTPASPTSRNGVSSLFSSSKAQKEQGLYETLLCSYVPRLGLQARP